jgi:F-type H+-transporting ATPase subunit gamma
MHSDITVANYSAFEIEDEALPNLREYALANSLYWVRASINTVRTIY